MDPTSRHTQPSRLRWGDSGPWTFGSQKWLTNRTAFLPPSAVFGGSVFGECLRLPKLLGVSRPPKPALSTGRGDWIRTNDLSVPNRAHYQAVLRPDMQMQF